MGTLAQIERNFWENVKRSVRDLTVREKHLADWSSVFNAQNPTDMIDAVRLVIRENHLPTLYVIIDANVRTDIGWFRRLAGTPDFGDGC